MEEPSTAPTLKILFLLSKLTLSHGSSLQPMPIPVTCKCGKSFAAPDKYAGKSVKCPGCSELLEIPAAKPKARPGAASPGITVTCPCGKRLTAKPEWAGKTIKCPACEKPIRIGAAKSPQKQKAGNSATGCDLAELLDEVDLGQSATGHRCPVCRADLLPDDVLCVKCGYNLESGRKIEIKSVTQKKAAKAKKQKPPKPAKAKKKKADSQLMLLLGLLLALGAVAVFVLKPELFTSP